MSGPFHLIGKTASLQISGRVSPEGFFYPMTGLLMRDLGEQGWLQTTEQDAKDRTSFGCRRDHSLGRHFFAFFMPDEENTLSALHGSLYVWDGCA